MVLQLPQEGHFPLHLVDSWPQSVQKNIVAIVLSLLKAAFTRLNLWQEFFTSRWQTIISKLVTQKL